MAKPKSPKLAFLDHEEQDAFDNLISVPRDEYKPGPTGTLAHMSLARTKIVRGGLGSGKTRFACEHMNNLALMYPGSLHYVGRRDITSLKITTQKEYLEKVVSPETIYTFNVNDNILYYKNASQVLFKETKDPQKVKSLELTSYLMDECDENPDDEIYQRLDDRLRQKIRINGKRVIPPYCGQLVFNPVDEDHWLYGLAHSGRSDVEDFRFSTYENEENLPPGYITNLKNRLPPWEVNRLIDGHWGRSVKGKPVIHGFTEDNNVRKLSIIPYLPLLVGWDFGRSHPALSFSQIDPLTGRYLKHREFLGTDMPLGFGENKLKNETEPNVVKEYNRIRSGLVSPGFPILHFGDPHGADKKDVGDSSVQYLSIHHNILVNYLREWIKTGIDEIQHRVLTKAPLDVHNPEVEESLFLVDPSCRMTIAGYCGGYHRDKEGLPKKDGYYDHLPDTDRYIIVNNMASVLSLKRNKKRTKRKPKNRHTGY